MHSLFVIHTRYLKNIFSQSVLSFDYLFVKICTRNSNGFKVSHQFKKKKNLDVFLFKCNVIVTESNQLHIFTYKQGNIYDEICFWYVENQCSFSNTLSHLFNTQIKTYLIFCFVILIKYLWHSLASDVFKT